MAFAYLGSGAKRKAMTSGQVGRQNASGRGFTVVELLMVLAIGALITAIAIPNVDQAMKVYRADIAARQVLNDLQATRMLALTRNVRYRMLLTANGTNYVVCPDLSSVLVSSRLNRIIRRTTSETGK